MDLAFFKSFSFFFTFYLSWFYDGWLSEVKRVRVANVTPPNQTRLFVGHEEDNQFLTCLTFINSTMYH